MRLAVVAAVGAARNPRWVVGERERISEGCGKVRGVRAGGPELSMPRQLPPADSGSGEGLVQVGRQRKTPRREPPSLSGAWLVMVETCYYKLLDRITDLA